jgi:ATP-dependent Clp protease ATP-binding subunit ClpA
VFERLTERARQVVVLAQEESRELQHNYIGTEHVLLGLVRESEGVAARILLDFDADPDRIRNEVVRMPSGPRSGWPARPRPARAELRSVEPSPHDDAGAMLALADLGITATRSTPR